MVGGPSKKPQKWGKPMFPKSLRVEVIALLCVKAAVLTLIYYVFVVPATKPEPDGMALRAHFLSQNSH